uniref:Histidine--tRNA ligase, chloroplastic n=1 Tax=Dichotomaria marginata TaxID=268567 RepID=A0A1G4NSK0_9FLOR|nr:Histidine-tRNA ligase [Dichotomaria marginata]SCW21648.1 Histidine-tRNA ligase [Dichotomaria marginata]
MQSLRGMHDILPEDIKYWQYIYNVALTTFNIANYQEIRTPMLEDTLLFQRSIGLNTDIINKEMYSFIDNNNRSISLRPEGTASIARAIIQHKLCEKQISQKLWYFGPMFRYERPQYGRQRQFHQLGLEYYGHDNPSVDAEIIYLATNLLKKLSCDTYRLEINSIGNLSARLKYEQKLTEYLNHYYNDLDNDSKIKIKTNPIKILDSKNQNTQNILQNAPSLYEFLEIKSMKRFELIQENLKNLDINFIINHNLVRGLDYYNDTVFEIKTEELGTQDTICGGGRYDELTQQIGGKPIASVGWGIGIERLLLIMKNKIKLSNQDICIYIAPQNDTSLTYSLKIIPLLHKYQLKYEIDFNCSSLKKQIQKANRKNAIICIIIGDNEVNHNLITIKWLKEFRQTIYHWQEIDKLLQNISKQFSFSKQPNIEITQGS